MDSGAMLATKSSAGVAPEVNLRNLLHAGDEARKRTSSLGSNVLHRTNTKSPKREYKWSHNKNLSSPKTFEKILLLFHRMRRKITRNIPRTIIRIISQLYNTRLNHIHSK